MIDFELPEGFTLHDGKGCPVPAAEQQYTMVTIICADTPDEEHSVAGETAAFWHGGVDDWWDWENTEDPDDRIVAWKVDSVIEPPKAN